MIRYAVLICMMLLSMRIVADDNKIYLMGVFNYKGTPISMAGLFYDSEVKDVETCKAYVRQLKGYHEFGSEPLSLYRTLEEPKKSGVYIFKYYICINDGTEGTVWNGRDFYRYTYLVDQRNRLKFTEFPSLNSCWKSIRRAPEKNTSKLFCAKMNQRLIFPR